MEVPLQLQFSIALFMGMIAATFVPPVRKSIPRPVEIILWIAFVTVCLVGVISITDPNARELSASAAWGAEQVINTTVALMLGGVGAWFFEHRFTVASWLVILAGADIFALMFIGSWRSAQAWRPRVRLRDWMELPVPARDRAGRELVAADPLTHVNRRVAAAAALAGATVLTKMVGLTMWCREVLVPRHSRRLAHAAAVGRIESRARWEGLREATAHLQYAARAWYAAAAEPALYEVASMASSAVRSARGGRAGIQIGQVVDIQALLSAQSIGWYGPFIVMPNPSMEEEEPDASDDAQRSDRLAS